jgi:hypothetical protein
MMLAALALGTAGKLENGFRLHDFQLSRFDGGLLLDSRDNTKPADIQVPKSSAKLAKL